MISRKVTRIGNSVVRQDVDHLSRMAAGV